MHFQKKAVADFEGGTCTSDVIQGCEMAYGEHRNTLVSCNKGEGLPKRRRITRPTVEDTAG